MKILKISVGGLSFEEAQNLATKEAQNHLKDPILLSWLNRKTGRHFPNVECCGDECKTSWEIYAESRGGNVRVEVGQDYIFIFGEGNF